MKSKPFLLALAAFAVTATGAQAFDGTKLLEKAGLSDDQITAFETAHELRESGDLKKARDVLTQAGVDEETLASLRTAAHENRKATRAAIEAGDYDAFKKAVAESRFADNIDSEAEFKKLVEAHTLHAEGKHEEAKVVLKELGIEPPKHGFGRGGGMGRHALEELSDDQREALTVAKKANDKEAVAAILKEAGIERPAH